MPDSKRQAQHAYALVQCGVCVGGLADSGDCYQLLLSKVLCESLTHVLCCAVVPTMHAQEAPQFPSDRMAPCKACAVLAESMCGICLCPPCTHLTQPHINTDKRFSILVVPSVCLQGESINFCPSVSGPAQDCDPIIAATLYCQRSGYDRATGFMGPVPAASTVAMQLMLDGKPRPVWNTTEGVMERCEATDGKTCSALSMVYCIREKMSVNPQVEGKPLDWCANTADGKKECGREAARAFCVRNSFSHGAWSWNGPAGTVDADGAAAKLDTVSLDSSNLNGPGKVCDSKQEECQTFHSINCEK